MIYFSVGSFLAVGTTSTILEMLGYTVDVKDMAAC